ncbi:MAG: HIT family protein [Steroidobacteraceae bacterium]
MSYDTNNIFARILRGEIPAHKVFEDEATFAFMDVMPQAEGHTLVVPKSPAENLFDLSPADLGRLIQVTQKVAVAVRTAFQPDGLTLMQFNGPEAGQTVFHIHFHVVPRYAGVGLRSHSRQMADNALLADHAERIRAALAAS